MKIAFVKQKYVPFGGGENYLAGLLDSCAEKGHEVHIITTEWQNLQKYPFKVHSAHICKRSRRSRVKSFASSVSNIVRENSFDVVFSLERTISQDIWRAGDCVYLKWLKQRDLFDPFLYRLLNKLSPGQRAVVEAEKKCVDSTSYIIANSEMIRNDLQEVYGDIKAQISVIYNGYDPSSFSLIDREKNRSDIRKEFNLSDSDKVILFAASGWRRKGLYELIQALPPSKEVKLLVIGRDDPKRWRKIARNIGVEKQVIFTKPRKDIEKFYHAVDLTTLPSWYDSFGFVVLESMACGTPVVVSRFAGSHELVQKNLNGVVVSRPDRIDELKEALLSGFKITACNEIASSVSSYTLEQNVKKTLDVIERAGR